MQMLQTPLLQKYDNKFNFFLAKPISEIVFNRTNSCATVEHKDAVIFSESNEYLKRTYHIKNSTGRNQIYDRIRMLADFYSTATMLKYEHPMMIITNTKNIFLKRLKRTKKMIASDCSSQETSENSNEQSQVESFSSSQFLKSIDSAEIENSSKSQSLIEACPESTKKKNSSYDSEIFNIYGDQELEPKPDDKKFLFFKLKDKPEGELQHLILDIDDVNTQQALRQYEKVKTKVKVEVEQPVETNTKFGKKSSIIITALENYVPKEQSSSSQVYNGINSPKYLNMKKNPPSRIRGEYDDTIRVTSYVTTNSNNAYNSNNTRQMFVNRTPNFGQNGQNRLENDIKQQNLTSSANWQAHHRNVRAEQPIRVVPDVVRPMGKKNTRTPSILNQLEAEHETVYMTNEASMEDSKHNRRSMIRDKAVALLHKVRSQEQLVFGKEEQDGRYQKHRQY